jgi:hypothetical protein
MSIKDVIEDIERSSWRKRYSSEALETAGEVEEYFGNLEDAVRYVAEYREFYRGDEAFDDPAGYAESWYESFGSMDGILDSLE